MDLLVYNNKIIYNNKVHTKCAYIKVWMHESMREM